MIDFHALQAAGIADARERAPLIDYLDSLGFSALDDMVEAERRGRLFGLAGDVLQWSGPPVETLRSAADALGAPVDDVSYAWAVLGLTTAGPDIRALSQADVDALATWVALRDDFGAMLDAVHRHHLTSTRTFIEGVTPGPSSSLVCGVGFVDLSGFTALTRELTPAELSTLLNGFSATVADVVHADGGRVVKFIGDYFGTPVNLAARLVAAASAGQILAAAQVRDELPNWPATAQDPLQLKGFDESVTAYDLHG
ncbi:adenylate/guanylate cyclase domain-containing protein [Mycobacterium sp.]|uniref:adenylate/guanylate cyclase domain-containing protein n=1 Tax=Mycobacterium sp. TaxID=1785 RepID=UPI0031D36D9A